MYSILTEEDAAVVAGVAVSLALILLIAIITTKALIKAAEYPPPSSLVIALSVLTLVSIAGGITTDNDEAWAIAAAGIGALAGSVTSMFQFKEDSRHKEETTKQKETEDE